MNRTRDAVAGQVRTDELRVALESALSQYFGAPRTISALQRQPSEYRSSFALEVLDVQFDDNTHLELVFKDTGTLLASARNAKPNFILDPSREIETYRQILTPNPIGTPRYYGAVVSPERGRYWLFLEKVDGLELYQVGEIEIWQQVSRWLAEMHQRFAPGAAALARWVPLILHDAEFYWQWIRRAETFIKQKGDSHRIERLGKRYGRVVERLTRLPTTVIHGEFYASNVLVQRNQNGLRVSPVDWEMAAIGPGLMDLAALTAGNWSEPLRIRLAMDYFAALEAPATEVANPELFMEALDYCRLQIAVQWIGWSPQWSPPPEHAHDWQSEAFALAEKLGLL